MIESLLLGKIDIKQTTIPDQLLPFTEKRLERNRIMNFIFDEIPSNYTYLDEEFECYHITLTEEYIYHVTFSVSSGSTGIHKIKCIVYKNNGNLYLQTVEAKNLPYSSMNPVTVEAAVDSKDIDDLLKDLEVSGSV